MQEWVRLNGNANTRRTYESGFRGFTLYLEEEKVTMDRLRPCDIADYLRLRFEEGGVAASTIAGDRAAIGDGLKNSEAKGMHLHPLVKAAMKICMNRAAQSKPKQHVSAELMRALVQQLDAKAGANWMDHRNVALLLTMMLGMLRESEAVEIRMEDVQVKYAEQAAAAAGTEAAQSVSMLIRGSKTDQAKKGASVMLAANPSDPSMCPVRRLEQYIQSRTRAGIATEFLFPKQDGGGMAKSTPCGVVQRLVEEANQFAMRVEGIEEKWGAPDVYGSHSLRRGGVTEARASGVEMLEIQRHGRWKSTAVWGYVGPTDAQRRQVTENIFNTTAGKKTVSAPATPVKPTKSPRKPKVQLQAPRPPMPNFRLPSGFSWFPSYAQPPAGHVGVWNPSPEYVESEKVKHEKAMRGTAHDYIDRSKPSPRKSKRKRADSDSEEEVEDAKEAERIVDELQMAEWQQGYGEEGEAESKSKTKAKKKPKVRVVLEERFTKQTEVDVAKPAAAVHVSMPARRAASKKAADKMKGQR